ncbi:MAM and LDL-receptor class A domain-containing protein 1-like [Haliotis rubra]|uniref:MAM and LDL-receptor class A domain-containing protein 1-like n=1 Tax=Haliotis rubra TaxID=36100 RepID=UPI001EE5E046|nr:MAM and LDL-receptor class A domain-containing protein 1-like [Haliotis rubra]
MALLVWGVTLLLLSSSLAVFEPGCSFMNNQCVYNVKLGHEGQCDTQRTATTTGGGSDNCCNAVQGNMNNLQGVVDDLVKQMHGVQQKLGMNQSASVLLNKTTNERDQLLQELTAKAAALNTSQANLAQLVQQSANAIQKTLNNCKGVLGLRTSNVSQSTASDDYTVSLCTFENTNCGYTDLSSVNKWKIGHGIENRYIGPQEDHTTGAPKGTYMYIDPTSGDYDYHRTNRTFYLASPDFQPAPAYCVRFWYNLDGADARSLLVYAKVGSGLGYPIWRSYGNHGQTWHLAEINVDSEFTSQPFKVVLAAVTDAYKVRLGFAPYYRDENEKDIAAIDDVYVYNTTCTNIPSCPPGAITRKGNLVPERRGLPPRVATTSHLVTITSKEEQDFLVSTIKQSAVLNAAGGYGWYTGGNDERSEGMFDWTDTGLPYQSAYSDWHQGQPNNVANDQNCLLLQYANANYEWGDVDCDEAHPYICEVELPVV